MFHSVGGLPLRGVHVVHLHVLAGVFPLSEQRYENHQRGDRWLSHSGCHQIFRAIMWMYFRGAQWRVYTYSHG